MLQHDSQLLIPPEQRSGRGLRAARAKAAKRPDTTTSLVFNGFVLTTNVIPAHGASQGGDWCEAIPVSDSIVALSIGDVCGHGASAVPMMMIMRQLARDAVDQGMKPGQILSHLNAALCTDEAPTYVTAILALLDTRLRKLTFANAGHPPPLITTGPLEPVVLGTAPRLAPARYRGVGVVARSDDRSPSERVGCVLHGRRRRAQARRPSGPQRSAKCREVRLHAARALCRVGHRTANGPAGPSSRRCIDPHRPNRIAASLTRLRVAYMEAAGSRRSTRRDCGPIPRSLRSFRNDCGSSSCPASS